MVMPYNTWFEHVFSVGSRLRLGREESVKSGARPLPVQQSLPQPDLIPCILARKPDSELRVQCRFLQP